MNHEQQPTTHEQANSGEVAPVGGPKIYVASLSDYNAGILHGTWLDATDEPEELHAGINQMLVESPNRKRTGEPAEEYAIHDQSGFGMRVYLDEYEQIEHVSALARGIEEHGAAYGAWWIVSQERWDRDPSEQASFEQDYVGEFGSLEEYGADLLDSMGIAVDDLPGVPEEVRPYVSVDVAAYARDLELSGSILATEGDSGVYVFWNN